VALLPVEQHFALVWTSDPAEASRLLALADGEFLSELQDHFGDRAGRFTGAAKRASFPLKLRAVNSPIALRTAIVGNAAQALHPIAGQGLNLGLRDAVALADVISRAHASAIGGAAMLDEYRRARRRDASRGIAFTDFLVSAFADARRCPRGAAGLASPPGSFPARETPPRRAHDPRRARAMSRARIIVAGGGPVGLAFAAACKGSTSTSWRRRAPARRRPPASSTCVSLR
jgi:2-polyprenyl-6-methoxyphenol hydroxylase-like FAD-dependent oxidoreductase